MYNKLFSKILFSSIWVESYATRIVWVTFIAAMDEDGIVHLATTKNVAALAQVTVEEAERAIAVLEGPDASSASAEHDGRRIERFPGGWIVLNAKVYREMATRDQIRQRTAERVRRFRANDARSKSVTVDQDCVTVGRHRVTLDPNRVTPSEAYTDTDQETRSSDGADHGFDGFWAVYPKKVAKAAALKAWRAVAPKVRDLDALLAALRRQAASADWTKDGGRFVPHAATWLRGRRWEDEVNSPTVGAAVASGDVADEQARVLAERMKLLKGPRRAFQP